jgi:mono/diheme cytochrome c family protein
MRTAFLALALASSLPAAETVDPAAAERGRQVLIEVCAKCHGADKQKGRLRLDSRAAALAGGKNGPALVPGDPAKSPLVGAIAWTDEDTRMPPKKKLSDAQIADLTAWVAAGAPWPTP